MVRCPHFDRQRRACIPPDSEIRLFPTGIGPGDCENPFGNRCGAYVYTVEARAARADELETHVRSLRHAINLIYERNPGLEMYMGVSMAMSYAEEALGDAAAPSSSLPSNACRCAWCEAKRNPGQRQYDEEMDRWIVFDGDSGPCRLSSLS